MILEMIKREGMFFSKVDNNNPRRIISSLLGSCKFGINTSKGVINLIEK